jgi:hypothetical protein
VVADAGAAAARAGDRRTDGSRPIRPPDLTFLPPPFPLLLCRLCERVLAGAAARASGAARAGLPLRSLPQCAPTTAAAARRPCCAGRSRPLLPLQSAGGARRPTAPRLSRLCCGRSRRFPLTPQHAAACGAATGGPSHTTSQVPGALGRPAVRLCVRRRCRAAPRTAAVCGVADGAAAAQQRRPARFPRHCALARCAGCRRRASLMLLCATYAHL